MASTRVSDLNILIEKKIIKLVWKIELIFKIMRNIVIYKINLEIKLMLKIIRNTIVITIIGIIKLPNTAIITIDIKIIKCRCL